MAEYRAVYTKVWRDDWFYRLDPPRKVIWMYLITNPSASVAGIYQLPLRFIAFDTDMPEPTVLAILEEFKDADKIDFEADYIWVKKLRDYQETSSASVAIRIRKDLALIPPGRLKDAYGQKYTLSTPCPHPVYEKEREGEGHEKEKDREREEPAPSASPAPKATGTPPKAKPEPKPDLLVTTIPHGVELQGALDECFSSLPRPIPAWKAFANLTQRKAYAALAESLGDEFVTLATKGLAAERTSRSTLLSWLEGCKRHKQTGTGAQNAARQQSIANPSGNPNAGRYKHAPFDPTRERVKPI